MFLSRRPCLPRGLLLHLGRDASGSLQTTLGESHDDASPSSFVGHGPVLVAPPVDSSTREATHGSGASDKPDGPVTLDVCVCDHWGDPVPGVLHVEVDKATSTMPLLAGRTPYQHTVAEAATFYVRGESPRLNLWTRQMRIFALPGSTHSVTLFLQGPRFRGRLLDARTEQPVVGAYIRLSGTPGRAPKTRFSSAMSTQRGDFDFELQHEEGTEGSRLLISHSDYLPREVPLPSTSEPIEVRLDPRLRCRGHVHADAGRYIRDATVRAELTARAGDLLRTGYEEEVEEALRKWEAGPRDAPFEDAMVVSSKTIRVDESGTFDFPLGFPGDVRGYVRLDGYLAEPFTFVARRGAEPVEVTLTRSPTPKGRIRFVRADGSPFEGLRVWVRDDATRELPLSIQYGKTDDQGWYDTSALRAGTTVRLFVGHPRAQGRNVRPPPMPPIAWTVRHFETITVPD
ncbi:MAG: hypothetical protein R3F05_19120 [Planctomycetota bacterium]